MNGNSRCNSCSLKDICTINKYVHDNTDIADIVVEHCTKYMGQTEENKSVSPIEYNLTLEERVQQINDLTKEVDPPQDTVPVETPCSICGDIVNPKVKCANCGKIICLNCAVEDPIRGVLTCDNCQEITSSSSVAMYTKHAKE